MLNTFIHQMEAWFDDVEANAVREYIKSGSCVTAFRKTREFKEHIAEYTGAKYCFIVPNGTVSLSITLMASGVKKDESGNYAEDEGRHARNNQWAIPGGNRSSLPHVARKKFSG